jgi:conjugative relaxase-like TrwC/TraI family protein
MLSVQPLDARGRAANGAAVVDYLLKTEYYVGADGVERCPSAWIGAGSQRLGLHGVVEKDALLALAAGCAPNGRALVQNARRVDKRLGYDLTFSADKSISLLLFAAAPDERDRLLDAHHRACDAALGYLRTQVFTRRGHGGQEHIAVDGLVIARFDHFASREREPQLHSHHFVANVALGIDGQFSTFDQREFFTCKFAAGALYRAELAHQLQALGYGIASEREKDADAHETGEVWHRVAGIDPSVLDAFSTRRRQIEAYMASTGASAQTACLATRRRKSDEPTFDEVMALTADTLADLRRQDPRVFRTAADLKGRPSTLLRGADRDVLERLHRYESAWTKADLITTLAKELGGHMDASAILGEADAFLIRSPVVALVPDRHCLPRWAAQSQVDLERGIVKRATLRRNDVAVRVPAAIVDEAIADIEREKHFTVSDEQRRAVQWVAAETGGIACLTGHAGTGKTATASAYLRAFQAVGRTVIGTALSWNAAEKLAAETGLDTVSIASLLAQLDLGTRTLDCTSVVLVDEAGMVGARSIARLQRHVDHAAGKLVLVGDCLQLQPIEAGAGLRLAIEGSGETMLTDIRRQSNERDRALARLFYRPEVTGEQLVDAMRDNGQVRTERYRGPLLHALAADYVADSRHARDKLVIAGTNAQCDALTAAIRDGLKRKGGLDAGHMVTVRGHRQRETHAIDIAAGDRLRFGRRDARLGVNNNTVGVVESVASLTDGGHRLRIRLESDVLTQNGRIVEVDTGTYNALRYAYVSTVHRAQGQGKQRVYWFAEGKSVDRNLGLVAFTRQQEGIAVYATQNPDADDDGLRLLARQLDHWRMKMSTTDLLAVRSETDTRAPRHESERPSLKNRMVSLVKRAMDAFRARCRRRLAIPEMPSTELSVEHGHIQQ